MKIECFVWNFTEIESFEHCNKATKEPRKVKGALSGLRKFLAIESPLKMMKNAYYFTPRALFVTIAFKFLSWLFGHVAKQLH